MQRNSNSKLPVAKKFKIPDYRIIAYRSLLKCVKLCKIYLIQKVVKIIKQLKKFIENCQNEHLKEKNMKNLNNYDKKLQAFKGVDKESFKLITCYLLLTKFNVNLDKELQFFCKEIINYKDKISEFITSIDSDPQDQLKVIIEKILETKQYKQEKFQIDNLVLKAKQKSKQTIEKRKAKKKKKIAEKLGIVQVDPENKKSTRSRYQIKTEDPYEDQEEEEQVQETNQFKKFKKYQTKQEEKITQNTKVPEATSEQKVFYPISTQMHPSLVASIQRKQQEKSTVFQGKKMKLS